jgi:hypothetical protein
MAIDGTPAHTVVYLDMAYAFERIFFSLLARFESCANLNSKNPLKLKL